MDADDTRAAFDRELIDAFSDGASSQLQAIVDEASRVLGRPMFLADRHVHVLAYTEHGEEEVDRTRFIGLTKQPLPRDLLAWFEQHGMWTAERPLRIPANPALDYTARVVAPIRCQGHHLGTLACTDPGDTMDARDFERLGAFAAEAGVVLYRERLLLDRDRSRERELLRDVLSTDEAIRHEAVWQLAELDLFAPGGQVAALAIPLDRIQPDRAPDEVRLAADVALMRVRRHLAPKHGLHLRRPDHALLVASLEDPSIRADGLRAFARRVGDELAAALPRRGGGAAPIVAIGGVAPDLSGAAASYDQALRTAKVAAMISGFGDVVCWDDLGVYQLLTEIPLDGLGSTLLHAGLRRLLSDPRAGELVPTLERFLDLAGNTQQTAASLYLHRTTLYHRLRRIEQLAGVDLSKGDDRLALHLSIKLARMQGVAWPAAAGETETAAKP